MANQLGKDVGDVLRPLVCYAGQILHQALPRLPVTRRIGDVSLSLCDVNLKNMALIDLA